MCMYIVYTHAYHIYTCMHVQMYISELKELQKLDLHEQSKSLILGDRSKMSAVHIKRAFHSENSRHPPNISLAVKMFFFC